MSRKSAGGGEQPPAAGDASNRPFKGLESLMHKAGLTPKSSAAGAPAPARPTPPPEPPPAPLQSDDDEFESAMNGIERARWQTARVHATPPPQPVLAQPALEERRMMEAAVDGVPALQVADHPEYIEGWIDVSGKRYLTSLRSGQYSIQEQLDLHGLKQEEARIAVEEFIDRVAKLRPCCVKIIHGRGMNSPGARSILKERLPRWLTTRRMSRHVVAYASAPFEDGGVGAVYVLLRRS